MKHLLIGAVASGLMLFGTVANAQRMTRTQYDYQNQQRFDHRDRMFDRVFSDLNRAENLNSADRGDRWRIERARREVSDFQQAWNNGNFDQRELNQAIYAMQNLVNTASLDYQTRSDLRADLQQMRMIRERHSDWR